MNESGSGFAINPVSASAILRTKRTRRAGHEVNAVRTISRRVRPVVVALAAMLAVVAITGTAVAATPLPGTIVSHVTFNPDGPNHGDFTATGAAVDGGALCQSGTFVDDGISFAGFQGRHLVQLQVLKTFTCGDDSGTFGIKMQIQANFDTGIESFNWVVTGGTGRYAALRGSGTGSTVPNAPVGNINTFEGFVLR